MRHAGSGSWFAAEWPGQLADLGDDQPYALWLRGNADLRFSCLRSVAIVGSRAATAYGSYVAAEFAASVAARGLAVVSGGAFGVDAAARSCQARRLEHARRPKFSAPARLILCHHAKPLPALAPRPRARAAASSNFLSLLTTFATDLPDLSLRN